MENIVRANKRINCYLPDKAIQIVSNYANEDEFLSPPLRKNKNFSGALVKIILEWDRMRHSNGNKAA